MPWVVRSLRGQRVLARCEADGTLRAEDGRVEVRYKPQDGRAYRAHASNLLASGDGAVLPDEHCAPAGEPGERKAKSASDAPAKAKAGPRRTSAGTEGEASEHGHGNGHEGVLTVYADGACSGNPGPAGLGVVIYDVGEKRELSEFLGHGTNNIAELTAILRAAEALEGEKRPIVLKTDSQYSIGVLTKGWKAKANPALIADVKAALAKVPTMKLRYVEGHAGHAGNERADELARAAVEARRTAGWKKLAQAKPTSGP